MLFSLVTSVGEMGITPYDRSYPHFPNTYYYRPNERSHGVVDLACSLWLFPVGGR